MVKKNIGRSFPKESKSKHQHFASLYLNENVNVDAAKAKLETEGRLGSPGPGGYQPADPNKYKFKNPEWM